MKKFIAAGAVALASVAFTAAPASAGTVPTQTIAEIVIAQASAEPAEFTTLLAAVSAADPAVLAAVDNCDDADVTVFAPTDAAFAAALTALGMTAEQLLADTELLTSILLYHVVPGAVLASDVVALDGEMVTTANGAQIAVSVVDGKVMLNGTVEVVTTDILACNGVIHVIDAVLVPPAGDDGGSMPGTGSNLTMTIIALGLLAMGSVIVLGSRRRVTA